MSNVADVTGISGFVSVLDREWHQTLSSMQTFHTSLFFPPHTCCGTNIGQFAGPRWRNGGFELRTDARRERASRRGGFVNKIHKSLRQCASLQISWLRRALFERNENGLHKSFRWADPATGKNESFSTSARLSVDGGGGEDNCFLCLTRKFGCRRQIIAAITENVSGCELDLGSWQHIRPVERLCGYSRGCLVSSKPVNILPLNQTEQTQSPLCQRSVGKVRALPLWGTYCAGVL